MKILALALMPTVMAAADAPLDQFMRLVMHQRSREDAGRWIMQTSTRTYRHPESGRTVVLVSTSHLGRAAYYESLAPAIESADAVLSEGSGGRLLNQPKPVVRDAPGFALHNARKTPAMARLLGLKQQSDWERSLTDDRWVLADLETADLIALIRELGLGVSDEESDAVKLIQGALAPDTRPGERARVRRIVLKSWLQAVAQFDGTFSKAETTYHERREAVMWKKIRNTLAKKKPKRAAILLGAAHSPAIARKLVSELGYRLATTTWHDVAVYELKE